MTPRYQHLPVPATDDSQSGSLIDILPGPTETTSNFGLRFPLSLRQIRIESFPPPITLFLPIRLSLPPSLGSLSPTHRSMFSKLLLLYHFSGLEGKSSTSLSWGCGS